MQRSKAHTRAKWLASLLLILLLMAMGSQNVLPQNIYEEHPLGDIPLDAATYQKYLKVWPESMLTEDALPASYDARAEGIVTSVKDQGSCGSCWAFASVGGLESHILKADRELLPSDLDLSEQQQVSCNTAMDGCNGGYATAIQYWEDKGPLDESCFRYTAKDSTPCAEAGCPQYDYRVTDYHTEPATTNGFKNSLYVYGPSYWRFNVYSDFDIYWNSGSPGEVYVSQPGYGLRGGHAVLLIGWDDDKGAFLCKNSWGGGGPNNDGTFWIAYSGHARNLGFGMSNFSLVPLTCSGDAECDDGLYCNGAETCVDGACQDGTPACADDHLFCNGTEVCDEIADDCGHTGDPCEPGYACDEGADQCYPESCWNGTCDQGENCNNCPDDCISGSSGGTGDPKTTCFKGVTDGTCHPIKDSPDCPDCTVSWCCGDGVCEGEEVSSNCAIDCGALPGCPNGTCDPDEDPCSCPADCGDPPTSEAGYCSDGIDNDCGGGLDCNDADCEDDDACSCLPDKATCETDSDCCSNKCRGGACR
jgi:hypothetical protein